VLQLKSNKIEGAIPDWIWELRNVSILDLSSNQLSGGILSNLSNLRGFADNITMAVLDAGTTTLVFDRIFLLLSAFTVSLQLSWKGKVHIFSGNGLTLTATLNLGGNKLSGRIPEGIFELTYLRDLNFSRNSFRWQIPDVKSTSLYLESLDLSENEFTGPIPEGLSTMHNLQALFLRGNKLSGQIPQDNGFATRWGVETFMPGNEDLCGPPLAKQCGSLPWIKAHMSIPGFSIGLFIGFVGVFLVISLSSTLRKRLFASRYRARQLKRQSVWRGHTRW